MEYLNRSIILFLFGSGYFVLMILGMVGIDDKTTVGFILFFNCIVSGCVGVIGIKSADVKRVNSKPFLEYVGIILNSLMLLALFVFLIFILKQW